MPIYCFSCPVCGAIYESWSRQSLVVCIDRDKPYLHSAMCNRDYRAERVGVNVLFPGSHREDDRISKQRTVDDLEPGDAIYPEHLPNPVPKPKQVATRPPSSPKSRWDLLRRAHARAT